MQEAYATLSKTCFDCLGVEVLWGPAKTSYVMVNATTEQNLRCTYCGHYSIRFDFRIVPPPPDVIESAEVKLIESHSSVEFDSHSSR